MPEEANRQKATVQVKVKILHPDQYLRPEMNASVAFISDAKAAVDACKQAISLSVTDRPRLYDQLGRALAAAGDAPGACANYKLSAEGDYAPGMARFAMCLFTQRDYQKAIRLLQAALDGSTFAKYKLAEFLCTGFPHGGIEISSENRSRAKVLIDQAQAEGYPGAAENPAFSCKL